MSAQQAQVGGEPDDASQTDAGDESSGPEEGWEDWEEGGGSEGDDNEERTRSLFDPSTQLSSPLAALEHDAKHHGFDLRQLVAQAPLDEYGVIRVINYVRSEVAAQRDPLPALTAALATCSAAGRSSAAAAAQQWPWSDDSYLKPVLQDDAMLWHDFGGAEEGEEGGGPSTSGQQAEAQQPHQQQAQAGASSEAAHVRRLEAENAGLRQALVDLRQALMPPELEEAAREYDPAAASTSAAAGGTRPSPAGGAGASMMPPAGDVRQVRHVDERYFESYSGLSIHYDMLSDKPRTETYQRALEANPELIKGKAVLDVGCGTGILSLFAARAGASAVTSVDGSKRIADFARQIAQLNRLSSESGGPITVVCGKLEELGPAIAPHSMDVIVSEWMGYALLFESMLDTVLYARDHFLKPGGAILPDRASIHIAGVGSGATGLDFWKDVYGFNMAPLADAMLEGQLRRGLVQSVLEKDLVTLPVMVQELDLMTMKAGQQDFTTDFTLLPTTTSTGAAPCFGLALWFDTPFSARVCVTTPVVLSTSPSATLTHWAQTVLLFPRPVMLDAAGGPTSAKAISGRISMVRSLAKHRSLDISLEYRADLGDGTAVRETQMYYMNVTADE